MFAARYTDKISKIATLSWEPVKQNKQGYLRSLVQFSEKWREFGGYPTRGAHPNPKLSSIEYKKDPGPVFVGIVSVRSEIRIILSSVGEECVHPQTHHRFLGNCFLLCWHQYCLFLGHEFCCPLKIASRVWPRRTDFPVATDAAFSLL